MADKRTVNYEENTLIVMIPFRYLEFRLFFYFLCYYFFIYFIIYYIYYYIFILFIYYFFIFLFYYFIIFFFFSFFFSFFFYMKNSAGILYYSWIIDLQYFGFSQLGIYFLK